jgi:hypothetical protein
MDMQGRIWCWDCGQECATVADYELIVVTEAEDIELICLECRDALIGRKRKGQD